MTKAPRAGWHLQTTWQRARPGTWALLLGELEIARVHRLKRRCGCQRQELVVYDYCVLGDAEIRTASTLAVAKRRALAAWLLVEDTYSDGLEELADPDYWAKPR